MLSNYINDEINQIKQNRHYIRYVIYILFNLLAIFILSLVFVFNDLNQKLDSNVYIVFEILAGFSIAFLAIGVFRSILILIIKSSWKFSNETFLKEILIMYFIFSLKFKKLNTLTKTIQFRCNNYKNFKKVK